MNNACKKRTNYFISILCQKCELFSALVKFSIVLKTSPMPKSSHFDRGMEWNNRCAINALYEIIRKISLNVILIFQTIGCFSKCIL